MPEDKRRSQRIKLSIPLRIHGTDGAGQPYECEARTVDLNRHGARIRISRPLAGGETIHVRNVVNRREADFRVAGPVSPLTKEGGVFGVLGPVSEDPAKRRGYGIECLDTTLNFWGITFPRATNSEPSPSSALLQCRKCQTTALLNISLVEVDVLETAGILSWPCDSCGEATPWGYANKDPFHQPETLLYGRRNPCSLPLQSRWPEHRGRGANRAPGGDRGHQPQDLRRQVWRDGGVSSPLPDWRPKIRSHLKLKRTLDKARPTRKVSTKTLPARG